MIAGLLAGACIALAVGLGGRSRPARARLRLAGLGGDFEQVRLRPDASAEGGFAAVVGPGALLVGLTTGSWPAAGLVAAAVVIGRALWRRTTNRRLRRQLRAAVPDATAAIAAELRAGADLVSALAATAPVAGALGPVLRSAAMHGRAGRSPAAALQRASAEAALAELGWLGSTLAALESSGAAVADVLDRLGSALDAQAAAAERMRSQLAGPRATAALLAGLPLLGVGLGQAAGAGPVALLLGRPLGWALCAGAALLDGAGLWWSARIVAGVTRARRSRAP